MRGEIDVVGGKPVPELFRRRKENGLKGSRASCSNLFELYVVMPRCFVWENVPERSRARTGEAFRCLLRAMDEVGYGLAWRILDAQFFGLAQRREACLSCRRLGSAARACEVLFEPHCMRWDHPPGKKKRALLAAAAGGGARTAGLQVLAAPASVVGRPRRRAIAHPHGRLARARRSTASLATHRPKPENGGNGAGFCDPDEKGM